MYWTAQLKNVSLVWTETFVLIIDVFESPK